MKVLKCKRIIAIALALSVTISSISMPCKAEAIDRGIPLEQSLSTIYENDYIGDKNLSYVEQPDINSISLEQRLTMPPENPIMPSLDEIPQDLLQLENYEPLNSVSKSALAVSLAAAKTPSVQIKSRTSSSITISATFPYSGVYGNHLAYYDTETSTWHDVPGESAYKAPYTKNGDYTITGLERNTPYWIFISWYDSSNSKWADLPKVYVETLNQSSPIVRKDGNHVYLELEQYDTSFFTGSNYDRWVNHLDAIYNACADLTGRVPYNGSKIGIKAVANNPGGWAVAGNPILWHQPWIKAQIKRSNSSDDWSNGIMHEICHDFDDGTGWVFDAEVCSNIKLFYVMENLNAKIYNERYYTGSEYKNFFYQNSTESYTKTIANGIYKVDGMTSILIRIKDAIGWQPFMQTYRYFNRLSKSDYPIYSIDKFNLFVSMLKYYSNYDVLSLLSNMDKQVIGNYYGGTVSYVDKPEWYHFNLDDGNGGTVEVYLSDIGGSAANNLKTIRAICKPSNGTMWKDYTYAGGNWIDSGTLYAYDPIGGGSAAFSSKTNLPKDMQSSSSFNGNSQKYIKDIQQSVNNKKTELLNKLYEKIGINPNTLTDEQKNMLLYGVTFGIDDNVFFGLVGKVMKMQPANSDYYFMRAKSFTDAVFYVGYTAASIGSAAEAVNAISRAGTTGVLALATSETVVGGVAFGTAAVAELAEAAAMSGVSLLSAKMADNSKGLLQSSTSKLSNTKGFKIRNVADDVLDQMEGKGGHTIEKHVNIKEDELIIRANTEGEVQEAATAFTSMSNAKFSVKQNLKVNASQVEKWLKESYNKDSLTIRCNHSYNIGYGVKVRTQTITDGLNKSLMVLVKDASDLGFYILTAYPTF